MEVAIGDGEDDDGDPAMALLGTKQHPSCSSSSTDLFSVSVNSSPFVSLRDCPASTHHFGHHLHRVEDILQRYRGVGQHGGSIGVIDGFSLLVLDLWVFLTDHQLIFRASSLPHGHLGRQALDHEGKLGLQGEAVPVKGAVCSMVVTEGFMGVGGNCGVGARG